MNSSLNKMKRMLLLLPLLLNITFADEVCKYIPGQTIFRCDNVLPNIVFTPGGSGNLTIYCCLTGNNFNTTDKYPVSVTIITNKTFRKQVTDANGAIKVETNLKIYDGSYWITSVDAPDSYKGFEAFPITVHFNTPASYPKFSPGALLKARFDVLMNIPGSMAPNIAVLPNMIVSQDWNPFNWTLILFIVTIISIVVAIIFKKAKQHKKIRKH